jgi:hypothetical protein
MEVSTLARTTTMPSRPPLQMVLERACQQPATNRVLDRISARWYNVRRRHRYKIVRTNVQLSSVIDDSADPMSSHGTFAFTPAKNHSSAEFVCEHSLEVTT